MTGGCLLHLLKVVCRRFELQFRASGLQLASCRSHHLKQSNDLPSFHININVIKSRPCRETRNGHDITTYMVKIDAHAQKENGEQPPSHSEYHQPSVALKTKTHRWGREIQHQHSYESHAQKYETQLARPLQRRRS